VGVVGIDEGETCPAGLGRAGGGLLGLVWFGLIRLG